MENRDTMTISEVGLQLGESYPVVLRRVMIGELVGWQEGRRWHVDAESVRRFKQDRQARAIPKA